MKSWIEFLKSTASARTFGVRLGQKQLHGSDTITALRRHLHMRVCGDMLRGGAIAFNLGVLMRNLAVPHISLQLNRFSTSLPFSEAIRSSLDVEILPSRKDFSRRFSESDIHSNRYHGGRVPCDPHLASFPHGADQYEQLMQYHFWKDVSSPHAKQEPELYITGPVGCGKSTFVDFYIRHYCPERGLYKDEFDKKLIVWFDARGLEYQKSANENFFGRLEEALIRHCKAHNIAVPVKSTRGPTSRAQEVLERLSAFCEQPSTKRYLVLVLDKLDNCTVAVQRQVIQYVNDIRKYTSVHLYKVIIPLWPTTYDTFSQTTDALTTGKPRISLGPPTETEFIKRRIEFIKDRIISETRLPLESSGARTLDDYEEFESFVDFVFRGLQTEKLGKIIRDLCNDDLRRELWIWEGILRSAAAEDLYKTRMQDPSRRLEYEWMESLFAGDRRTRIQQSPRIANLFTMHHNNLSPRDFLAGCYSCQLLAQGCRRTAWYVDMERLGYQEKHLGALENSLRRYNLLHPVPEEFKGEDFEVHHRSVNAYLKIVSHPAYVDNVAMITPVDAATASSIRQTSGHIAADFKDRIYSSTAFIEFVGSQEREFVELFKARVNALDGRTRLAEMQWIDGKKLFSVSHAMAQAYMDRLNGLVAGGFLDSQVRVKDCLDRLKVVRDAFRVYIV